MRCLPFSMDIYPTLYREVAETSLKKSPLNYVVTLQKWSKMSQQIILKRRPQFGQNQNFGFEEIFDF